MKKNMVNGMNSFECILPDYGRRRLITCADSIRELADTFQEKEKEQPEAEKTEAEPQPSEEPSKEASVPAEDQQPEEDESSGKPALTAVHIVLTAVGVAAVTLILVLYSRGEKKA